MILTSEERGWLHRIFVAEWQEWFDVDPQSGCWLWKRSKMSRGYGNLWLNSKTHLAHRMSYAYHTGPIPEGLCVMHSCDTPLCVNPAHISVGTNMDNVHDKMTKGRAAAKFTEELVRQIRRERAETGISYRALGKAYGVSFAHCRRICCHISRTYLS